MGRSILVSLRATVVTAALLLLATGASLAAAPAPEELLKSSLEYLGQLSAVSATADVSVRVQAMGRDQTMDSKFVLRAERPDKWALLSEGEPMAWTFLSDGKNVYQYVSVLNRYTAVDAAEPSEPSLLTSGFDLGGAVKSFDAQKLYDSIAGQLTESKYLGREKVGDVECHHCRFDSKAMTVDIWFEVGDRPLVWKIVPDMAKTLATAADGQPAMKGMKIEYLLTVTDWNVAPKFTAADFTFTPPTGAEKVDSLFGSREASAAAAVHPLLGQPAPPFELDNLAGDKAKLADHLGKDVVILDFWATWCGPCVEALPLVNAVAEAFAGRGVKFYAVNISEDQQTVAEFLKEQELEVPVILDTEGNVAQAYKASAIPQTVLIGKDGKVQVVHVGFGGNMKELLGEELEKLLKGKDLAGPALAEAEAAKAKQQEQVAAAAKTPQLESIWQQAGPWTGVAVDPKSHNVYAIAADGALLVLDAAGRKVADHKLSGGGRILRIAELKKNDGPELLTFGVWSSDLAVSGPDGTELWSYGQGNGIDDVWAADLDADGQDEVMVGFNGGTGLHVLGADGTVRWQNTDLANVWHVSAGDLDGDGANDVVSTSAMGAVHVFSADGTQLKDIRVPVYANMIRTAELDGAGKPAVAIVTGSGDGGETMVAVDFDGKERWQSPLPHVATAHVGSLAIATSKPWGAVAMREGLVHVVDLKDGKIIAHAKDQGMQPEVAWIEREGEAPVLVIAGGSAVSAFDVAKALQE